MSIVAYAKLETVSAFTSPSEKEVHAIMAMRTGQMRNVRTVEAYEFPVKLVLAAGGWLSESVTVVHSVKGATVFPVPPEVARTLGGRQVVGTDRTLRAAWSGFARWKVLVLAGGLDSSTQTAYSLKFRVVFFMF